MTETTPSSGGAPEGSWDWISKPLPWGQISLLQIVVAFGLGYLNDTRVRRGLPKLDALEVWTGFLAFGGLTTGVFAYFWSRRLERLGRKMATYSWLNNLIVGVVFAWVFRAVSDQASAPRPVVQSAPGVEVPATEVKKAPTLRTSDGQFEVDVPSSWTNLPQPDPRSYGGAMTDPSGQIGIGLYSEPRERSLGTDAVAFGEQRLMTFSSKFDEVNVLESTASFRPGQPPFRQIVETRSGMKRTRFVLVYGQSSKAFFQVRVWAPSAEFQVHEPLLREIAASFREVP